MAATAYLPSEEVFDKVHIEYEAAYGATYPGFEAAIETLTAQLPAGATLLDAGCGTASLVGRHLAGKGYRYHGVDISQEMINLARRNYPEGTFTKGDLLEYIPDRRLDGLIAAHAFYQVAHHRVRAYLERAAAWLKPQGILLLCMVPGEKREPDLNLYDREWGYIDEKPTTFMGQPTRQSFVTSTGWHKLVQACGFEIIEAGEYGFQSNHAQAASENSLYIFATKPLKSNR